jgi:hypothetical protein
MDAVFNMANAPRLYNADGSLNRDAAAAVLGAIQNFMMRPARLAEAYRRLPVAELTTSDDFPAKIKDVMKMIQITPAEIDLTYEQVFDIGDYTNSNKSGFKVRKATSGLAFRKVGPGERIDVYKFSGDDYEVPFDDYGGAIGFLNRWFEDEDFVTIESVAKEFRAKYYQQKAKAFISLIEGIAAATNVAWQGQSTDSQVTRDILTINAVIEKLIQLTENTGLVSDSTQFIIYAPLRLKGRILRALDTTWHRTKDDVTSEVVYDVKPLFSPNFADVMKFYGVIPKMLLDGGNRKDLVTPTQPDVLANAQVVAGWGRYGGAVGKIPVSGTDTVVSVVRGLTS